MQPREDPKLERELHPAMPCASVHGQRIHADVGVSNGIGLVAFFLNVFMAFTWMLAGKRHLSEQPFQLRFCVFAGIFYGAVATIPSLVMKYDLPCECETEEW